MLVCYDKDKMMWNAGGTFFTPPSLATITSADELLIIHTFI